HGTALPRRKGTRCHPRPRAPLRRAPLPSRVTNPAHFPTTLPTDGADLSTVLTILSILGFIALTAGTALFVAAEFSLTALERSTVEAAARSGDVRSRMVRQAHRTLSFQLSGAQLGITITTLITGYIAEPV